MSKHPADRTWSTVVYSTVLACAALPTAALAQRGRTPPEAPGSVQSSVVGQLAVHLTWADQSSDERGFRIVRDRQLSATRWGEPEGFSVGPNVTSYVDHPSPGTYRYRVRAYNLRGNSSYVAAAPVVVSAAALIPVAPASLAIHDDGNGVARLTWTDRASNETAFEVERQPSFTSGSTQTVGADTQSWLDQTEGGKFAYRVRAIGGPGASQYTPWVRASILTPLGNQPAPVFPVLTPGHGFTGPTPQPPPIGNPSAAGYDAKAIARWDVVPYQTFTGDFDIGVVAFHVNGIDRVEFSVDGGPWEPVYEMQLNPESNVVEYTATLRASMFEDGPVEVRAIVWPTTGKPRVLAGDYSWTYEQGSTQRSGEHSIQLFANSGGSLLEQVVQLPAGTYSWGRTPFVGSQEDPERWMVFRAAPGVDPDDVVIDSTVHSQPSPDGSINFKKVRLQNLTVRGPGIFRYMGSSNNPDEQIWLDGVKYRGRGQWVDSGMTESGVRWSTNSEFSDLQLGPASGFVRNCRFTRFGEDVMRNVYFVANVTVDHVDRGPRSDWHPAVIANPYYHDNRIYYGLTVTDNSQTVWAFRNGTHETWENHDVAIVNCDTERSGNGYNWFCGGDTQNMYVKNSRFIGGFIWRLSEGVRDDWRFRARNVVLENVNWQDDPEWIPQPYPLDGVRIIRN